MSATITEKFSSGCFYHAETLKMEMKSDYAGSVLPAALNRSSRYA
jgi:hypothetical protein